MINDKYAIKPLLDINGHLLGNLGSMITKYHTLFECCHNDLSAVCSTPFHVQFKIYLNERSLDTHSDKFIFD